MCAVSLRQTSQRTPLLSFLLSFFFLPKVAFDNIITQEEEYTVTISTELNGRTVTQMVEKFPMGQQDDPLDST